MEVVRKSTCQKRELRRPLLLWWRKRFWPQKSYLVLVPKLDFVFQRPRRTEHTLHWGKSWTHFSRAPLLGELSPSTLGTPLYLWLTDLLTADRMGSPSALVDSSLPINQQAEKERNTSWQEEKVGKYQGLETISFAFRHSKKAKLRWVRASTGRGLSPRGQADRSVTLNFRNFVSLTSELAW